MLLLVPMAEISKTDRRLFGCRLSRQDAWIFAAVGIVAFAVRLLYLWTYSKSPYWDALVLDPGSHWKLARSIAHGQGMGEYPYFRAPLYFYLVAGFMKSFAEPLWGLRIFQALVGSLTASLTAALARQYLGRAASAFAGLLFALYWVPVYFDGEILIASPATFLGVVSLLAVMAADRTWQDNPRKWPWFGVAGLVLGVSVLARPNTLVFAAAVPAVLVLRSAWKSRQAGAGVLLNLRTPLAGALLFCLGVAACLAPATVRNRAAGGEWLLLASQGGINFWIGNNKNADGRTVVVPLPRSRIPSYYLKKHSDHPWINENVWISSKYVAEQDTGRNLGDGEVSDYWYGQSLEWMVENPGEALSLLAEKTLFVFQAREVGNNRDILYHQNIMPVLRALSAVNLAYLGPLILAGLVLAMGRARQWMWPLLFFICYAATVIGFFVTSRYRMPLFPVGMCFAAFTLEELYRGIREFKTSGRGLARLAAMAALVGICAFLVNMPWPKWNDRPLRSAMHYNQGMALYKKHSYDAARQELQKALAIKAHYPEAHFWLGKVYEQTGQHKQAAEHYERSIEQAPSYAPAHYELGRLYLHMSAEKGDRYHRRARVRLEKAHRLAPRIFPRPDSLD